MVCVLIDMIYTHSNLMSDFGEKSRGVGLSYLT